MLPRYYFKRATLTLAALIWLGGTARTQTTATPAAPFVSPAFVSPISPLLFGPPSYPYRATAPSSTTPAPSPAQISSGISHAPSLGSMASPPPMTSTPVATRSQPAIGPFIELSVPFSLLRKQGLSSLPGSGNQPSPDNRAHIWLRVPTDAKVWFDGKATTQTGGLRLYNSPELAPGKKYHYEVRVRWTKDGKPIEERRRVEVEAKDWLRFDFTRSSPQ